MPIRVGILKDRPLLSFDLPEGYTGREVIMNKIDPWHMERVFRGIDTVLNTLPDVEIQHFLEAHSIPYVGSRPFSLAVSNNNLLAQQAYISAGLVVLKGVVVESRDGALESAKKILKTIAPPWLVKSMIVFDFPSLVSALENIFEETDRVLIREHIRGEMAVVVVIDDFRGKEHYSLPVGQIMERKNLRQEIFPSHFKKTMKEKIEEIAKDAHKALGCRHYSRSNFVVSPKGDIYILNTETSSNLLSDQFFIKMIEDIGLSHKQFLGHILNLALCSR